MPNQPKPLGWCYKSGSTIIRGFNSSPLFREDCLTRKAHSESEFAGAVITASGVVADEPNLLVALTL